MRHDFFQGRYGVDGFSIFLMIFAILFIVIPYLWILGIILAAYVLFRAFSRNTCKRQRELRAYNGVITRISVFFHKHFGFFVRFNKRIKSNFSTMRFKWKHRKESVFPRCPKCHSILRLPRGRGTLMVTCTVCGHEFKIKT